MPRALTAALHNQNGCHQAGQLAAASQLSLKALVPYTIMGAQPELERSKMLGDEEVAGSEKLVVEPKQNTSLSALSRPATLLLVVGMVCLIGGMSSCTGGAGMTSADTTQDLALRLQTRPSTFFQLAGSCNLLSVCRARQRYLWHLEDRAFY